MGYAVGFDTNWNRDVGYGVPSICDKPGCDAEIDRGFDYVCGGDMYGGEHGCGLFFCGSHLFYGTHNKPICPRCLAYKPPYKRPTPDTSEWIEHKLTHKTWQEWRDKNPAKVERLYKLLGGLE